MVRRGWKERGRPRAGRGYFFFAAGLAFAAGFFALDARSVSR